MSQVMWHEVELRITDTVVEQVGDLLGDPLIRYCSRMDRVIGVDHALSNMRSEMRLYRGDPLPEELAEKSQ